MWEWHIDPSSDGVAVVGGQLDGVVGTSDDLGLDVVHSEAGVAGAQLGVDASNVVVNEVLDFLGNFTSTVSTAKSCHL